MQSPPNPQPRRKATLADVAAASGVATSTVSRALSTPGRVNSQTRERIESAARELNYRHPSRQGATVAGRANTVAVLVSDITNPFYFDIIRGTQQQLKAAGYMQLLIDTEESDEFEEGVLRNPARLFDGAILAASRLTDRQLTAVAGELPIVAINRQTKDVPSVFIDTPGGMEQALGHLVSLGHTHIAYVSGPVNSWPNERRWRALTRAGARYGVTVQRVGPFSPSKTAGAGAADAVIAIGVTACIAFNDILAIGMLSRFRERGVSVPSDLSIVGCDDMFGADFCNPPLTTVSAPIEQAARVAVSILLSRLDPQSNGVRNVATLSTHLTVRESTGPVPSRTAPAAQKERST
jgi:DNA-binding LacI/PurR family transcriptional regulator